MAKMPQNTLTELQRALYAAHTGHMTSLHMKYEEAYGDREAKRER
jgi:FKBP-type peptidyl-prolyl cis-trans isomerase 2